MLFYCGTYIHDHFVHARREFITNGVDLNYGVDLVGYGNDQTLNKVAHLWLLKKWLRINCENQTPKSKPVTPIPKRNNRLFKKTPVTKR
jgi:hypothetical protein